MSDNNIVVTSGRVRAGYEIGERTLREGRSQASGASFTSSASGPAPCTTPIRSTSGPEGPASGPRRRVDHDMTKLVCNIADTALEPKEAARETIRSSGSWWARKSTTVVSSARGERTSRPESSKTDLWPCAGCPGLGVGAVLLYPRRPQRRHRRKDLKGSSRKIPQRTSARPSIPVRSGGLELSKASLVIFTVSPSATTAASFPTTAAPPPVWPGPQVRRRSLPS